MFQDLDPQWSKPVGEPKARHPMSEPAAADILKRAESIPGDATFYVEARVGSANHRGECCRALWNDARCNVRADDLIRLLAAELATASGEIERLKLLAPRPDPGTEAAFEAFIAAYYGEADPVRADVAFARQVWLEAEEYWDGKLAAARSRIAALEAACKMVMRRWTFNDTQGHTHNWHDWADCVEVIRKALDSQAK